MKPAARGFTLVEVVVAIGILALMLIAGLGLLAVSARSGGDGFDADATVRLGENVQGELERLKHGADLAGLAAIIPPSGAATPLRLVATRDGRRVLRCDGAAPAADRALDDPAQPGIAVRDRYYLLEVEQQLDLPYVPDAGFLAVSVRVTWPYQVPTGPAVPDATAADASPAREVPENERRATVFHFALRP
ncbi:MAG: prepilin-type N-terminal cleavage/methylation domain-containing protein [Opitutaceae bacterium]|nr:prepilin-type N-terminal cleavage/methylation domain-containing protein [Opitutaceae bacterium]